MDEALFLQEAQKTLKSLLESLEQIAGDFDVEESPEGLTVDFADGKQLLVTKHSVSKQLWVSSPISGASHYHLTEGSWQNTRGGGGKLEELVLGDTAKLCVS